ncbi:hypothetical protein G7054_g8296 [Neopestalotiopsis clavispora]|nr:hypothetical protein G7054_g8296 [Neopestalotiopsis clavispora]
MAQDERIDEWIAKGIFDRSRILERLELAAKNVLQPAPEKILNGLHEFDQESFTSQLHDKGGLPQSCSDFGPLVYNIIAYLGATPFHARPGERPSSLSLSEVYCGLTWVLPDLHQSLVVASNRSRARTTADHRRLLFQSLATNTHESSSDPIKACQRATDNAQSSTDSRWTDWITVNFDDDGDEMYHDVLDVLHATQPETNPPYGDVKRDDFRDLAKTLAKDQPQLHTLAIPRDEFTVFVTFLLALQFEHKSQPNLSQYEDAARSLTALFCETGDSEIITWPQFDDALQQTPFLFDPLHRLLSSAFLKATPFAVSGDWLAPQPPEDSFMNLPRLSQLATIVNQDVDFENFGIAHQWNTGIRPTADVLLSAMNTMPDLKFLVMRGLSSSGEESIFGALIPTKLGLGEQTEDDPDLIVHQMDAVHDQVESGGTITHVARPTVFILGPSQHAVRFEEMPKADERCLHFGGQLMISDNGSASLKAKGAEVLLNVKAVEIWGETSSRS